jgi:hypothetical protein
MEKLALWAGWQKGYISKETYINEIMKIHRRERNGNIATASDEGQTGKNGTVL